jgi:cellulose synthase operon protein C
MRVIRRLMAVFITLVLFASASMAQDANSHYEEALRHFHGADLKAAIIEARNAIQADVTFAPAQALYGRMLLAAGNGIAAEESLRKARRLGANEATVLEPLVEALVVQRNFKKLFDELNEQSRTESTRADALALRGIALFEQGRATAATQDFSNALKISAKHPIALTGSALMRMRDRDYGSAERLLLQATETHPNYGNAWYLLGRIYTGQSEYDKALEMFRLALVANPFYVAARASRGELQLALGNDEAAADDIQFLLDFRPLDPQANYLKSVLLRRQGDTKGADQAVVTASRALQALSRDYVYQHLPSLYLWAVINFYEGRDIEAQSALIEYIRLDNTNAQARKLLGILQLRRNNAAGAIKVLGPAVQSRTRDAELFALLGRAYLKQKRAAKAVENLRRAVELDAENRDFQLQLAMSHLAQGEVDAAVSLLEAVRTTGSAPRRIIDTLGQIYLRKGRYGDAVSLAEQELSNDPKSVFALNLRGAAFAAQRQYKRAAASFEQAAEAEPKGTAARYNLAELAHKTGDIEAAKQWLEDVLKDHPNEVRALAQLAEIEQNNRNLKAAIARLEKLAAVSPQAVMNQLQLVELYLLTGNLERAKSLTRAMDARFPNHPRVLLGRGRVQLAAGDRRDAAATFARMGELVGNDVNLSIRVARLQLEAYDVKSAQITLDDVLSKDASNVQALVLYVEVERANADDQGAWDRTRQLRDLAPEASVGYELAGAMLMRKAQYAQAFLIYKQGALIAPSQELTLGYFLSAMESSSPRSTRRQQAFRLLEDWVTTNPKQMTALRTLAGGHAREGRFDRALALYEAGLKQFPNDARTLNSLAGVYGKTGDPRAVAAAEKALKLAPNSAAVKDTLGWLLLQSGPTERALKLLRQARDAAPNVAVVGYHLSVALHQLGRDREAFRELRELLSSTTSFDGVDEARALLKKLEKAAG